MAVILFDFSSGFYLAENNVDFCCPGAYHMDGTFLYRFIMGTSLIF